MCSTQGSEFGHIDKGYLVSLPVTVPDKIVRAIIPGSYLGSEINQSVCYCAIPSQVNTGIVGWKAVFQKEVATSAPHLN